MKHKYVHQECPVWLKVPIQRRDTSTPLTCHGLLLFAYLMHVSRKHGGVSQRRVRCDLGMDADTVSKELKNLAVEGLVELAGGKWSPLESVRLDQQFQTLQQVKSLKGISDRFCYVRTYLPTKEAKQKGLTLITSMLYWRLVDWAEEVKNSGGQGAIHPEISSKRGRRKGLSIAYLVDALRCDAKTVRAALGRLEKLGLIRRIGLGTGYFAVAITVQPNHHELWRKAWGAKNQPSYQDLFGVPAVATPEPTELPDRQKLLLQAGIPGSMHQELLDLGNKANLEYYEWKSLLLRCKSDHERNRAEGRTSVPHPGCLFHHELSKRAGTKDVSLVREVDGPKELALNTIRRIPGSSERLVALVEKAVSVGAVPATTGILVPVPVDWQTLNKLAINSTFHGFVKNLAKAIFLDLTPGLSPWLDELLSVEPIPEETWSRLRTVLGKSLGIRCTDAWDEVLAWVAKQGQDSATATKRTQEIVDATLQSLRHAKPSHMPTMDDFRQQFRSCVAC